MNDFRNSVLIVETDPSRSAVARDLLQSAGYRVRCAGSFDEAKRLLASELPHILITGLRLGEYNGLHLVLRIRVEHPQVAAIVTSEVPDRVLAAEAERQCAEFLINPWENGQLLRAVNRTLRGHIPPQEGLPRVAAV